jgi:hypothetical protein
MVFEITKKKERERYREKEKIKLIHLMLMFILDEEQKREMGKTRMMKFILLGNYIGDEEKQNLAHKITIHNMVFNCAMGLSSSSSSTTRTHH